MSSLVAVEGAVRGPVDPGVAGRCAVSGRVVTMDAASRVLPQGTVYVDAGRIVAVTPVGEPAPAGFETVPVVRTGGTLYPGLIELHNHLPYNVLRLWDVPARYANRDAWARIPDYRRLISGPLAVLGRTPDVVPSLVRYVECKCLLGGVTTSQGVELYSNHGLRRFFRGVVRNVEQTDEPELPEAAARIADVDARDAERFRIRLGRSSCLLLHLSEGVDEAARRHFLALRPPNGDWAVAPQLAGIHCAGLEDPDFEVLGSHGASMVWSPLSNLLLYGRTARVDRAKAHGVRIGLGSDWSPSGSKNLLGELKVARLVSQAEGDVFSDRELVAMATCDAATILGWGRAVGSLEVGKRADLIVVAGNARDPYATLLEASETALRLVMINGVGRVGTPALMRDLGASGERIRLGGRPRVLNLAHGEADGLMAPVTLRAASDRLADALERLPALAEALERAPRARAVGPDAPEEWTLALDEWDDTGLELRPRLPDAGGDPTGFARDVPRAAVPLSELLGPLELDELTVADDETFLARLARQRNLPPAVAEGLPALYR